MDGNGITILSSEFISTKLLEISQESQSKRFWVGLSGGIDSVVLLHLLKQAFLLSAPLSLSLSTTSSSIDHFPNYFLGAVHVHHGLSPNADRWTEFCRSFCSELNVPLEILYVDAAVYEGKSPEAVAREARYEAWRTFLQDDNLVLAHHLQDQAETILLRLFRGAGPLGLGGMAEQSKLGNACILRPLLELPKSEIEAYANLHKLKWIEDESNENIRFDRNFLRHQILPKLTDRWPAVLRSICRSGALCSDIAESVQELAENDYKALNTIPKTSLSVKELLKLPKKRRQAVIRLWIQEKGLLPPSKDHMDRIDREVLQAQNGSKPQLKISEYKIKRIKDILYLE